MKYVKNFLDHFKEAHTFTFKEAERFLVYNGATKKYPKRFIQNMIKIRKIFKITRGVYTTHDIVEVSGFAFSPFYYGLTFALSFYNIWEERANPTIITTKMVRVGIRKIFGTNISIFRMPKELFFGYSLVKGEFTYYPISDPEKTLIDFVYFKINLRDDVLKRLISTIDKKRLKKYLNKCNDSLRNKVELLLQDSYLKGKTPKR